MAAISPTVRALLESAGIDANLEDVPARYEVAPNPIEEDADFSTFRTDPIVASAGEAPSSKTDTEKYWHIRQYYIQEERAKEREEVVAERLEKIQETLKNGDVAAIKDLFKMRHAWRQRAAEFCTNPEKICENESCTHVALAGSSFCASHILQDPDQKLFVECSFCHRPYPAMSKCFACRE